MIELLQDGWRADNDDLCTDTGRELWAQAARYGDSPLRRVDELPVERTTTMIQQPTRQRRVRSDLSLDVIKLW